MTRSRAIINDEGFEIPPDGGGDAEKDNDVDLQKINRDHFLDSIMRHEVLP